MNRRTFRKGRDISQGDLEKTFTPDEQNEMTAASSLNRIFKSINILGFCKGSVADVADDIKLVRERFGICSKGAILLAAILEKSGTSHGCDEEDLSDYLGCTNIEFINFHESLKQLEEKGIIECNTVGRAYFSVTDSAYKSIEQDSGFKPKKMTGLNSEEFFFAMMKVFKKFRHEDIPAEQLDNSLSKLIKGNDQLLFCRRAIESVLGDKEMDFDGRVFLFLSNQYVTHGQQSVPIDTLLDFTGDNEGINRIRNRLTSGNTRLQKEGIFTFGNREGFSDSSTLALSDTVKSEYFQEIEVSGPEQIGHKCLISHTTIKEQELFYNKTEGEQIERLSSILEDENFHKVSERLEREGLPKGFCAVFHGCPGSGKTASLRELARRTGRDLFWVDLSSIKSKWVGESEQNVKHLFNSYRNLVRASDKVPILAVNEADAIFTKRITDVEQSVDQMNNAITDIVLNEMETLDGILIATTNLVGNMMDSRKDNAMERRFLFKIEFNTPSEEVRAKIWKSKIKNITEEEASQLAERYTFSGGNIENIARKSTMEYVLSGIRPDYDTIVKYCDEEKIGGGKNNDRRIGF